MLEQVRLIEEEQGVTMRKSKQTKLEAAGWAVGSVEEFPGLSEADAVLIEMKLALSRSLQVNDSNPAGLTR